MYIRVDYEFKTTVFGITGCSAVGEKYYDARCWDEAVKDVQKILKSCLDATIDIKIVERRYDDGNIKTRFVRLYGGYECLAWDKEGVRTVTKQNITAREVRKIIREIATEELL